MANQSDIDNASEQIARIVNTAKEELVASLVGLGTQVDDLNTFFANLYNKLTEMGYEAGSVEKQYTKENQKKSLNGLDKLIEQVILYKNTEEK